MKSTPLTSIVQYTYWPCKMDDADVERCEHEDADYYGVYAQLIDGTYDWVIDCWGDDTVTIEHKKEHAEEITEMLNRQLGDTGYSKLLQFVKDAALSTHPDDASVIDTVKALARLIEQARSLVKEE